MTNVKRHPVDFEKLSKGDVITIAEIEDITGVSSEDHEKFSLARLALQDRIDREMRDRDRPVTVATRRGQLVILTDEEASDHNAKWFDSYWRRIRKSHRRSVEVDTAKLSDIQRRHHEHRTLVQAQMIAGAREGRKLALAPTERTVPKIDSSRDS